MIEYMKHPKLLKSISVEALQEWIDEFPYSQNLRILLAKKIRMEGGELDDKAIVDAAIYSTDRSKLQETLLGIQDDIPQSVTVDKHHSLAESEDNGMPITGTTETESGDFSSSMEAEGEIVSGEIQEDPKYSKESSGPERSDKPQRIAGDTKDIPGSDEEDDMNELEEVETESDEEISTEATSDSPGESRSDSSSVGATSIKKENVENGTGLSPFSKWLLSMPSSNEPERPSDVISHKAEFSASTEDLISTSLAELLTAQGHIDKAIVMYEKLNLKYPEKSAYFAGQIQKLKAL